MSKLARVAVGLIAGYALGAALGAGAVQLLSSNVQDKDLETVMTALFAAGPLGSALGAVAALLIGRKA